MANFSSIFEIFFGLNLVWVISDSFQTMILKNTTNIYKEFLQIQVKLENLKGRTEWIQNSETHKSLKDVIDGADDVLNSYNDLFIKDESRVVFNFVCFYNVLFCLSYLIFTGFNFELDISKDVIIQKIVLLSFVFLISIFIFQRKFKNPLMNPISATIAFVSISLIAFACSFAPKFFNFLMSYELFYTLLILLPIFHFLGFYFRVYWLSRPARAMALRQLDIISRLEQHIEGVEKFRNLNE